MVPMTFQESIDKLQAKAVERGSDNFRVRVIRQRNAASPPESLGVFLGAKVEQINMFETWIPDYSGGGKYTLTAYHEDEPNTLAATVIPPATVSGEAKAPDPRVVHRAEWRGPPELIASSFTPATANGHTQPRSIFDLEGSPGVPGIPVQKGGAPLAPSIPSLGGDPGLVDARMRLMEAQHRSDLEQLQRTIDVQLKATERHLAAINEAIRAASQRPEPRPVAEQIAPLLAAAAPIVTALLSRSDGEAKVRVDLEDRRLAREEKLRSEASDLQRQLIEKLAAGNAETAKVMASMAEVVSASTRGQLQMIATIKEITAEPQTDEGWTGIVKAGLAAYAEAMLARRQGQPPPALPNGKPAASVTGNGSATGNGNGASNGSANGQDQPPANPPEDVAQMDPNGLVAELDKALHDKLDPESIAEGYVDMLANKGVVDLINAAGGTLMFFRAKLGDEWLKDNREYATALVQAVKAEGESRGVKAI